MARPRLTRGEWHTVANYEQDDPNLAVIGTPVVIEGRWGDTGYEVRVPFPYGTRCKRVRRWDHERPYDHHDIQLLTNYELGLTHQPRRPLWLREGADVILAQHADPDLPLPGQYGRILEFDVHYGVAQVFFLYPVVYDGATYQWDSRHPDHKGIELEIELDLLEPIPT